MDDSWEGGTTQRKPASCATVSKSLHLPFWKAQSFNREVTSGSQIVCPALQTFKDNTFLSRRKSRLTTLRSVYYLWSAITRPNWIQHDRLYRYICHEVQYGGQLYQTWRCTTLRYHWRDRNDQIVVRCTNGGHQCYWKRCHMVFYRTCFSVAHHHPRCKKLGCYCHQEQLSWYQAQVAGFIEIFF